MPLPDPRTAKEDRCDPLLATESIVTLEQQFRMGSRCGEAMFVIWDVRESTRERSLRGRGGQRPQAVDERKILAA